MVDSDTVRTGIKGFDAILEGGIPRGNIILVEGAIGTGKTTMGVEFIYRGASQFGEPGIIVLFEVSPAKVTRDALKFGWDLEKLEKQGLLKIIFTTRDILRQELQQADSLLLSEAADIHAKRIFIDGVARLVGESVGPEDSRSAFHVLTEGLQRENLTALLAVEASMKNGSAANTMHEESIADTVIRLSMEPSERAVQRTVEVIKSRGQNFQMGRHTLRILNGLGLQVYRRVMAPRPLRGNESYRHEARRTTTGVPGLDRVVNGGYYEGSTTVTVGISGVGKSVMGLHYMAEGVRLGQKCLMVSLDERVEQVLRNADSIGLGDVLRGGIKKNIFRIVYEAPQELEIDVHFERLEEIVNEMKPKRVVFDSLSTYGTNLGSSGRLFRDFFHALVALMKENRIAAVYNHENPEMLGMNSMMGDFRMSSLVDNIILLNWVEIGDSFRLGLIVAKMRGNPVDRVTRECEVSNGKGMRVLDRALPVHASIPFSDFSGLVSRAPDRRPVYQGERIKA